MTTDAEQEASMPTPSWMPPLIALIESQLNNDFIVDSYTNQDGTAGIIIQNRRYREPHGRISIVEDDPHYYTGSMSVLLGVQGIGGSEHVCFTPDEDGVKRMVWHIGQYYKAVDFIRTDAVSEMKE